MCLSRAFQCGLPRSLGASLSWHPPRVHRLPTPQKRPLQLRMPPPLCCLLSSCISHALLASPTRSLGCSFFVVPSTMRRIMFRGKTLPPNVMRRFASYHQGYTTSLLPCSNPRSISLATGAGLVHLFSLLLGIHTGKLKPLCLGTSFPFPRTVSYLGTLLARLRFSLRRALYYQ